MSVAEIVEAQEGKRVVAMIAGDTAILRNLLSPELLWIHSSGKSDDLSEFLGRLESGAVRYLKIEREDIFTFKLADGALVTGLAEMTVEVGGKRKEINNRYCNLWHKSVGGDWQMKYWQSTNTAM